MSELPETTRLSAPVARRLAPLLILTALFGCDNVEWGGVEMAIVPPAPKAAELETEELPDSEQLPDGPVLYYVQTSADTAAARATLTPVAEVTRDGMQPIALSSDVERFGERFIAAFLREGTEFTLFRRGRRVGTVIVDSASVPGPGVCRRLPRATGSMELSGMAGAAGEFLAMAKTNAPEGRVATRGEIEPTSLMRRLGPILAERMIRARRAPLPNNWQRAFAHLQPFPVPNIGDAGFAATFLVDDTLGPGLDEKGYALFFVATPQGQVGYDTALVRMQRYEQGGKAAPRVVDYLDWDRDGAVELLLQVYGSRETWFAAAGSTDGQWSMILDDRCDPTGATLAADTAAADTTPRTQAGRPSIVSGSGNPAAVGSPAPPQAEEAEAATRREPEPQVRLTPPRGRTGPVGTPQDTSRRPPTP